MTGETNLSVLIQSMRPTLHDGSFAFVLLPDRHSLPAGIEPVMMFREGEGLTLIVRLEEARSAGLTCFYVCRWITLNIHSSLAAVGFLAAVTRTLAERGISMNAVSAVFHDHIFVDVDRADEAVAALAELSASGSR